MKTFVRLSALLLWLAPALARAQHCYLESIDPTKVHQVCNAHGSPVCVADKTLGPNGKKCVTANMTTSAITVKTGTEADATTLQSYAIETEAVINPANDGDTTTVNVVVNQAGFEKLGLSPIRQCGLSNNSNKDNFFCSNDGRAIKSRALCINKAFAAKAISAKYTGKDTVCQFLDPFRKSDGSNVTCGDGEYALNGVCKLAGLPGNARKNLEQSSAEPDCDTSAGTGPEVRFIEETNTCPGTSCTEDADCTLAANGVCYKGAPGENAFCEYWSEPSAASMTWEEADQYCVGLAEGGVAPGTWTLAGATDYQYYCNGNVNGPFGAAPCFNNVGDSNVYWTGSCFNSSGDPVDTRRCPEPIAGRAAFYSFSPASYGADLVSETHPVRCVRVR